MPLRIAVLSTHTCPLAPLGGWETGGMNVYVRELGRALGARGVEVDIFTRRQSSETPDVVEYAPGARVVHLEAGPRRHVDKYDVLDYLPDLACGIQRWRALTGLSYDLIHSHYWLSGRLGLLFADRWGVPMVSMFHTLAQLKNRVAESAAEREQAVRFEIERRTMAGSERVIAATDIDRAQIVRHYGVLAPIEVIPGGVDLERFRPRERGAARRALGLAPDGRLLLFVGRIQRLKGVEVLLRAFAMLLEQAPDGGRGSGHAAGVDAVSRTGRGRRSNPRLVIVGGRPSTAYEAREIARLEQLSHRLGITERVRFVGAVSHDDLPLYYAAADVTVMPSSYESFGLVAVESLACGTPVVATRVGGLRAIVREGETGFLIPWRDPALFAERLAVVLGDAALRRRLSAAGPTSVARYGWDRIAGEHLEMYAEVRAGHRQRRAAVAGQ